ncbi:unnamed protein product [Dovyalis caffra]|uniref:Uncharacterized protein n=1 Tax=Dovyalis caffra TaxID=77055 RepID=A0AAV1R2S0_9ROSI|nr:unnamed protein product [Dovyalis caffra]
MAPYQSPGKSVRRHLIPNEDEPAKPDEGFFGSLGRLILNTSSTVGEIFGGIISGFRRKPLHYQLQQHCQQPLKHSDRWPVQDSFVIPDEDELPPIETRSPIPQKTHPFMTNDKEHNHHLKQNRGYYGSWEGGYNQQQQQQMQMQHPQQMHLQRYKNQQQQQHHRNYISNPKTYYEKSCETNEIVFGAVQEQNGWQEAVVIKAVDYGDSRYNQHNIRPRFNYVDYPDGH